MIQYEYYTLTNETYLQEGLLNALGERGWELVTHVYDKKSSQHAHVYTFKKQKSLPFGTPNSELIETRYNVDGASLAHQLPNDEFWENPALYSKLEHAIVEWSNDNTKTAGELTRQILKLVK